MSVREHSRGYRIRTPLGRARCVPITSVSLQGQALRQDLAPFSGLNPTFWARYGKGYCGEAGLVSLNHYPLLFQKTEWIVRVQLPGRAPRERLYANTKEKNSQRELAN